MGGKIKPRQERRPRGYNKKREHEDRRGDPRMDRRNRNEHQYDNEDWRDEVDRSPYYVE